MVLGFGQKRQAKLADLHLVAVTARVAHLPVRLRDGAGLVGPLVIPGVTSCLGYHQGELLGHTAS
jgi:hypothetical protein